MTFTLGHVIAAPPSEVFAFVADFATTPLWYSAVQRVERMRGSVGIGTRYAVHRRLPSGPVVNTVEVTEYVEGHEVTFTSIDGPTPFTYRYRVAPGSSGTHLELEGTISAAGIPGLGRLLGSAAEPLFARGMRDNLGTLQRILEQW